MSLLLYSWRLRSSMLVSYSFINCPLNIQKLRPAWPVSRWQAVTSLLFQRYTWFSSIFENENLIKSFNSNNLLDVHKLSWDIRKLGWDIELWIEGKTCSKTEGCDSSFDQNGLTRAIADFVPWDRNWGALLVVLSRGKCREPCSGYALKPSEDTRSLWKKE